MMHFTRDKLFPILALIMIPALLLMQLPTGNSQGLTVELEDEALSVITGIIGLDATRYRTELYNHNLYSPTGYGGLILEDVAYNLSTTGSNILVVCTFVDRVLIRWDLVPLDSSQLSPHYAQPLPASSLDAVKNTLQRYQAYSKSSIIQEALSIIDSITQIKTMNVTNGDLKMRIVDGYIDWVRIVDGLEFPTGISIRLSNGIIDMFSDESSLYRVGSSSVNISREEAILIATEKAKAITTLNVWVGDKEETVPFHVKEEPSIVRLQVGTSDLWSYPYWYVWFIADPEVYHTTGVEVCIRAETGAIAYCQTTGYYGDVSPAPSTTDQNATQESNFNSLIATYLIAGAIIAVIVISAAAVIKKRSK